MSDGFIPLHGGYQKLLSYRKAGIVYDATVYFCARFLDNRDRTCDQMVQAVRPGKQNIVEGSVAAGTSREMEIKLTNVARQPRRASDRLSRLLAYQSPRGMAKEPPLCGSLARTQSRSGRQPTASVAP